MTKLLLIMTALVESATGVALLASPSTVVTVLLGEGLSSPQSLILGRITGAALISIGAACWFAMNLEPHGRRGLVRSMLLYNIAVPVLLLYARCSYGLQGIAFWPGCILHLGLSIWCVLCLQGH